MMKPYRTILIDDHPLFSHGLKALLNNSPDFVVVDQVSDSRLAYESCAHHQPDLVLIDYNMPHVNGLDVVEQLRQLPTPCCLVIVSMYAEKAEIAQFVALGVHGYFAKTIHPDRLVELLKQVMQGERIIEIDLPNEQSTALPDHFRLRHKLSDREVDILNGLKQELSTKQIAAQLELSPHTVQTHRKNINRKLRFKTEKEFNAFLDSLEGGPTGR